MFKSRLSAWGFSKNSRDREYQICARLHKIRKQNGKLDSLFIINGNKRSLRDLRKYIKGRKMSEDDFIALAEQTVTDEQLENERTVRAVTPTCETTTPEGLDEPDKPPSSAKPERNSDSDLPATLPRRKQATFSSFSSGQVIPDIPYGDQKFYPTPISPGPTPLAAENGAGRAFANMPNTPRSAHSSSNSMDFLHPQSPNRRSSQCQYFDQHDVDIMAYQTVHCNDLRSAYATDNLDSFKLLQGKQVEASDSDAGEYNIICPKCHELVSTHFRSLSRFNDTSSSSSYVPSPSSSQSIASPSSPSGPRSLFHPSDDLPASALTIPLSIKEHDHSWKFVSRCYLTCIQLTRFATNPIRNPDAQALAEAALADAEKEMEAMIVNNDEKIILTLNQTLMVCMQHDQGPIIERIMKSVHTVIVRRLGSQHPLEVIARMMVLAADPNVLLKTGLEHRITSDTLYHAWQSYVHICDKREKDLRSIGAMYSYGWILNVDAGRDGNNPDLLARCESVLSDCYELSCERLGKKHLQSIQCLINLRLCHERQGRIDDAIEDAERVIRDSLPTLGKSHPRRLETMRSLAVNLLDQWEKPGNVDRAEALYKEVLIGRVRMLGRDHIYTRGMKTDYIELLKYQEKWNEEGPCTERDEILDLFEWDMMEIDSDDEAHAGAF
jgi:hypothetical protein